VNRIFKTFLLWLLIAALPVQGMAAVVKASCGPTRHESLPIAMHSDAHHHHSSAAAHHHDSDTASDSAAAFHQHEASSVADQATDSPHLDKSSSCSACAACCFGAVALPSSVDWTPVFSSSKAEVISAVISFTGFIPAGLERPPKPLFA
jgi:hypothetical protein